MEIRWDEEGNEPVVHFSFISIGLTISLSLPALGELTLFLLVLVMAVEPGRYAG